MSATPVQKELSRIARDYRRFELFKGVSLVLGIHVLLGVLLFVLNRSAGISVPLVTQLLAISAFIVTAVVWIRAERLSFGPREIARQIEQDNPQLNTLLLAAAEQMPNDDTGRLNFLQQKLLAEALEINRRAPWTQKFVERLFYAQCVTLGSFVSFLVVLLALSSTLPANKTFAALIRGEFKVTPGDASVERGSALAILAEFPKKDVPSKATLIIEPATGTRKAIALDKSLQDPLFGTTLPDVREDFKYSIEFDNGHSKNFKVTVFDYPDLKRADAELVYPEYTSLPSLKIADTRHITAVEGTSVHYAFSLNKPVKQAELRSKDGEVIALTNNPAQPVVYNAAVPLLESKKYELRLVDEQGRTNKLPPEFVFAALKNERPKLKIQSPRGDQRVSALQELRFEGQAEDDFGLKGYGVAYTVSGGDTKFVSLTPGAIASERVGAVSALESPFDLLAVSATKTNAKIEAITNLPAIALPEEIVATKSAVAPGEKTNQFSAKNPYARISLAVEKTNSHSLEKFRYMLPLEPLGVQPEEIVSYFVWAEDLGPDGKVRRTDSDMYFAEVRAFEEIFREGQGGDSSSGKQGQQGGSPSQKLTEIQKQIITATWNLKRAQGGPKLTPKYKDDATTIQSSQREALSQAGELIEKLQDEKAKALASTAEKEMEGALDQLTKAAKGPALPPLEPALVSEQNAYQALLKLQGREYQVNRSRRQQGGQSGGQQQRAQRQLDQLELKDQDSRYEKESEATPLQSKEQRETVQVLNRLKELAQRQQDMSERLKELQTALNEAKTEEEKEALRRQLKRLQEEQQQIVQDMDELQQRMSQPENRSRMDQARQQVEQTRSQSREAADQLQKGNVSQALSSSTRAQRDLQKLADDFRKSTSGRFNDELRQLRQDANKLDKKEEELAQKFENLKQTQQKTLSENGERKELLDGIAQQKAGLSNVVEKIKAVTEASETAEPLLSRQLYETLRKTAQSNPEKALDLSSQFLERNFLPQSSDAERKAAQSIKNLNAGVEEAAKDVLGDETEALRLARAELQELANKVEREMQQDAATNGVAMAGGKNGTNSVAAAGGQSRTNQLAMAGKDGNPQQAGEQGKREGGQQEPSQSGDRPSGKDTQASNNSNPAQGQQQQNGQGQSQQQGKDQEQKNGQGQGKQQEGQGQSQGEGQGQGQQASNSEQQNGEQSGNQQGQGGRGNRGNAQPRQGSGQQGAQTASNNQNGGNRGQQRDAGGNRAAGRNFYDEWSGGGSRGGGGGEFYDGPLTGPSYTAWSDRLRDVEEMLDDPDLRNDVARVRDRARAMRMDLKKRDVLPRKELVFSDIITPLRIVQNRVADELARRESKEAIVPVDRDPVPKRYSDLVSRYYENLGKSQ
jgi:hypothetical protein